MLFDLLMCVVLSDSELRDELEASEQRCGALQNELEEAARRNAKGITYCRLFCVLAMITFLLFFHSVFTSGLGAEVQGAEERYVVTYE
jgi:hypothetical protein